MKRSRESAAPKKAAVILARMDSIRLPGKALLRVGGIPLIELIFRRLIKVVLFDSIVLATTSRPCDLPLADFFKSLGGKVFLGSEDEFENVAKRFVSAAESVDADFALRVNGDSPFPDADLIKLGADLIVHDVDLVTNLLPRTYPYGSSVEWIRVSTLHEKLERLTFEEREHITKVFYENQAQFHIVSLPKMVPPGTHVSLTIDDPGDLHTVNALADRFDNALDEVSYLEIMSAWETGQSNGKHT